MMHTDTKQCSTYYFWILNKLFLTKYKLVFIIAIFTNFFA